MTEVSDTLAERGGRYGAFEDHAKIAQGIQDAMRTAPNWNKLDADMRQALTVIADKCARILNGDPYYEDNWHDIQGYAKLVETRITELKQEAKEQLAIKELADRNTGDNWEECHSKITWTGTIGDKPEHYGVGLFGDEYTG